MQFPESWLRSLVNPALDTAQLAHAVTMAGLEVEALAPAAPPFNNVVVAEILSAEKHPDADRLRVCQVDVGEAAPVTIVCGAPNAAAGLKVPCARPGAQLPVSKSRWPRCVVSSPLACCARLGSLAWKERPKA